MASAPAGRLAELAHRGRLLPALPGLTLAVLVPRPPVRQNLVAMQASGRQVVVRAVLEERQLRRGRIRRHGSHASAGPPRAGQTRRSPAPKGGASGCAAYSVSRVSWRFQRRFLPTWRSTFHGARAASPFPACFCGLQIMQPFQRRFDVRGKRPPRDLRPTRCQPGNPSSPDGSYRRAAPSRSAGHACSACPAARRSGGRSGPRRASP